MYSKSEKDGGKRVSLLNSSVRVNDAMGVEEEGRGRMGKEEPGGKFRDGGG